ncbi:hypothetical protein BLAT2472_11146 [Burkholderia latens]
MRVSFTTATSWSATRCARGSRSITRKLWNHAARLTEISSAISRKVRQNSPPNASCRRRRSIRMGRAVGGRNRKEGRSGSAVRDEHVAEAPDGLDETRAARIGFDQLAQARDLHVEAAVEHFVFAAARKLHQLFTRQRLARVTCEHLEHGEFAGGQRNLLAGLRQRARREVQREFAELEHLGGFRWRTRQLGRRLAAQHRVNARDQFARVERLRQVIVGAHLETDDSIDILALRGEHDDRCAVVAAAQAAADRQAVLAGQHQVEHQQVEALAHPELVHRGRVLRDVYVETLLAEISAQQIAQARVVVDDENLGGVFRFHERHLIANGKLRTVAYFRALQSVTKFTRSVARSKGTL